MWNGIVMDIKETIKGHYLLTLNLSLFDGFDFWVTNIYGPNSNPERTLFWNELDDLSNLCLPRWIMGCDYNVSWERSSQKPINKNMRAFSTFISTNGLIDPPLSYGKYTWTRS